RLQVDSPLVGVRVGLPAPLGKTSTDAVPFRFQLGLGSGDQLGRVQYGSRLSGGLVWSGGRLDRALMRLDSTTAAWPERSGLEVEGRMAHLDVGEWQPVVAHFQRVGNPTVTAGSETPTPDLTRLDLDVQELLAGGWRLRNAHLGLTRSPSVWQMALDSDELAATAKIPDDSGRAISLGFSRLQWPLPLATSRAAASGGPSPASGLGNRAFVINGEGLRLTAWPGLGAMNVKANVQPLPAGVRVEDIALHGPLMDFHGTVDWQWRGGASTRVQGRAESTDITGLFSAFGVTPPLVSRQATCDLDLGWQGAPDRAAFSLLDGHINLGLEQGRLLNVSAGASASRIFGWFSLANLQRRLKGDFADVTRRGLAFDSISLEGPLEGGVMAPADVQLKGPTMQAKGQGRLDIGRRKVDQQYVVTMPVTSAVPLAAVMMAGPVIGGAVAAAQMAFDKQIGKATELHYRVSGDWENPQVERLSGHDTPPPAPQVPAPAPAGTRKGAGVNVAKKEAPGA
ncbi:MAG TPA: AsmA-like C-terminal region-containing protein, partial [Moraxellaceae bacterium]|nr:AsmA-like C-terminal region-containing protein [Moraxellaceae bacterium]